MGTRLNQENNNKEGVWNLEQTWRDGDARSGFDIVLSVGIELKGTRGTARKDWQLIPMGSFNDRQGVCQLWTWWSWSSGADTDRWT